MAGTRADGGQHRHYDVIQYSDGRHEVVPAGEGDLVVAAHRDETRRRRAIATLTVAVVGGLVGAVGAGWLVTGLVLPLGAGLVVGACGGAVRYRLWRPTTLPEVVAADVSEAIVRDYVDEFDPGAVSSVVAS
jgi:hypothetical protein